MIYTKTKGSYKLKNNEEITNWEIEMALVMIKIIIITVKITIIIIIMITMRFKIGNHIRIRNH